MSETQAKREARLRRELDMHRANLRLFREKEEGLRAQNAVCAEIIYHIRRELGE